MIEKCSIGNMSYNIQNITLIILILILIIVIIYYLRNSSTKHNELIEKYTTPTDIKSDESYNTHNAIANSLINSEFPTSGTEVTLRACQVQFNNKFDDNPNDTVRYVYQDDWQEIATLKEPGPSSTFKDVPIKIISRSNETNQDAITNYSERSKCFKKMSATDNKYRYQGNALINYSTGIHSQLKVDPSGVQEDYMEMKFNLLPANRSTYYNNLKTSICSLIYTDKLGGTRLDNLGLYRLTLDANNIITAINQITINSANNHIFTVSPTTSFSDLLSSTSTISYVYSNGNFIFQNNSSLSDTTNDINIRIYNFNRELLCSHIQKNIKSYKIIDNKVIDANKIVNVSNASVSLNIENTSFPNAASSYASKNAIKTDIEERIKTEIATANADAISKETAANTNITTYTTARDTFLTSINTRDKFLDKIFDNTILVSRRNFLVSTSGLINGLKLNMLGYKVEDISSDETILNSSEEPSFQKIINNTPANIDTVEIYTDTSRPYTKTFDTKIACEILIVGGGGGGGGGIGGGGGGGAVVHLPDIELPAGTYTINVGNGGVGRHRSKVSDNGSPSSIVNSNNTIRIFAEGGGGTTGGHDHGEGSVGGSGGGAAGPNSKKLNGGAKGTSSSLGGFVGGIYGNPGGSNTDIRRSDWTNAAGGGGAGAAAANIAPSSRVPGNGGDGKSFNITGRNIFYGGGGGGGGHPTFGIGGKGGGGNGTSYTNYGNGGNGQANTGGGGGGGAWSDTVGGNGGSGIVIIRYKNVPQKDGDNHKKITLKYDNDNLFAWYNFDSNYNDASGNGNNLTNHGTSIITAQKIDGKAIEFDNTDYLEFPATMNPYTIWYGNGITFSFWVRFTAHGNWARIIDIQSGGYVYNGILISANSTHGAIGSGPALSFFCNGSVFYYYNNDIFTKLGIWHHIVFSIDKNGRWDIYLNNVRINNAEVAPVPNIPYNLRYINRSVYHWDGQWKGQMDDFRIYKTSLSASEVAQLYNKTRTLPSNIYRATLPIQTNVDLNGETKTLDAGIYNITMGPLNTVIKKHNIDIEIGKYTHTDGNKFIFKYATSRSLQQLHNLETPFSGTVDTIVEDKRYFLGDKTLDMTTKYEVYIYHRRDITHSITLYADTRLLTNDTDYIASTVDEEVVTNKIYLLTYSITIKENIEGNIYLKSDKPIFYIDETNRANFNDTTDTQFSDNVNNLKASGSATLTSLNNMFDISTANAAKATAVEQKITYNIDAASSLTIAYNSSTIDNTRRTSLNNLKTTYNNIHNYNESSGGTMTPIINTNTFGSILEPVATNIEEYISYEFPSAPSEDKLTPSSRTTAFDIKSNATKYIYFKKR